MDKRTQQNYLSHSTEEDSVPPTPDDMHHNNQSSTDNIPNYQSSESFTPAIQNNIRILGQHMVVHLCPPFLINEYLPNRSPAEQLQLHSENNLEKSPNSD